MNWLRSRLSDSTPLGCARQSALRAAELRSFTRATLMNWWLDRYGRSREAPVPAPVSVDEHVAQDRNLPGDATTMVQNDEGAPDRREI